MGREAGTDGETLAINFLKDYYESTGVPVDLQMVHIFKR
ncbi:MAG: hypothetical protein CM15mP32_6380 [Flavobacteriaceae bacterium]|nr:MAG: hypothetical protein CM15mP32_6380 [Flavobacteriaceae bacterium]